MVSPSLRVEMAREAVRLEQAARRIRRHAGGLRYHPVTGMAQRPGEAFQAALRSSRESLAQVAGWVDDLGAAGERVRLLTQQAGVALDVLAQALARPERAPLDAPYGLGSPRRPHPGAQATWVAERAEELARALARLAVIEETASA